MTRTSIKMKRRRNREKLASIRYTYLYRLLFIFYERNRLAGHRGTPFGFDPTISSLIPFIMNRRGTAGSFASERFDKFQRSLRLPREIGSRSLMAVSEIAYFQSDVDRKVDTCEWNTDLRAELRPQANDRSSTRSN